MRGFSAVAGSWKTTETERPNCLRMAAFRLMAGFPWNKTLPDVGGWSPTSTDASVDLPQPDSPTMPTVSPRLMVKSTPSTALTMFGRNKPPVRAW
ncbi:hypothetical protein D3C73_1346450 [compost metagenome]